MPEIFGARLRHRREERQIDLISIAKQTKIKPSLLEALERDDVSQWPSGFYRRAFIRAYAQAIDLDPDAVVREFLAVHPEPPAVDVLAAMASTLGTGDKHTRAATNRVFGVVGLAIGSLSRLRRGDPELPVTPAAAPAPVPPLAIAAAAPAAGAAVVAPVSTRPEPTNEAPSDSRPELLVAPPSAPAPALLARADEAPADRRPATPPPPPEPDLLAVARLCTDFALAGNADEVQPLLLQASTLLNATGLIVWLWDASTAELRPALVHGYSQQVIAQLPGLPRDADNATALAFRSAEPCTIAATEHVSGALVTPLLTAAGCAGVLAIELRRQSEQTNATRAVATILAALLAQMTAHAGPAEAERLAVATV